MTGAFDFDIDLKTGQDAEDFVIDLLKDEYPFIHRVQGYFKQYDIIIPEIEKTIEVKNDLQACDTGNYFIETACGGKESGITTSSADIWVIVDNELVVLISTNKLRTLIKDIPEKTYPPRGKDKERTGKLIKRDLLLKHAKKIATPKNKKEVR